MRVNFNGKDYRVRIETYRNGRTAIVLVGQDGELAAVATVNITEAPLPPDQVLIKDYSENKGMLAVLEKVGIVQATGTYVLCGHATMALCKLLVPPSGNQETSPKPSQQTQRSESWQQAAMGKEQGRLSLGELKKVAKKIVRATPSGDRDKLREH